jgi:hypothetical protein
VSSGVVSGLRPDAFPFRQRTEKYYLSGMESHAYIELICRGFPLLPCLVIEALSDYRSRGWVKLLRR